MGDIEDTKENERVTRFYKCLKKKFQKANVLFVTCEKRK